MKLKNKRQPRVTPLPIALEQILAEAAWHEALVRICAGLVHDTNNCLAGIVSLSEHCLAVGERQKSFHEELSLIKQSGNKAGQILKSFGHLNPAKAEGCAFHELNAVVEECTGLLRRVVKRRLELELRLGPGPLPVLVDGLELRKAIICLAFNIADASPEPGKIIFETRLHTDAASSPQRHGHGAKAPTVCLSVLSAAPQMSSVPWDKSLDLPLTGNPLTDLLRLRFCLVRQIMERARGALSIGPEANGYAFNLFLPKANLE